MWQNDSLRMDKLVIDKHDEDIAGFPRGSKLKSKSQ